MPAAEPGSLAQCAKPTSGIICAWAHACARQVHLNHEGIRKIVKKLDKNIGGPKRQPSMLARLATQPFCQDGKTADELIASLKTLCSPELLLRCQNAAQRAISCEPAPKGTPKMWALLLAATAAWCVGTLPMFALKQGHVHERAPLRRTCLSPNDGGPPDRPRGPRERVRAPAYAVSAHLTALACA